MTLPFEAGELLIAATDVDDRNVDLRTGQTGLVVGLAFVPVERALFACDPGSQTVTRFDADGRPAGLAPLLPRARIGTMPFLPDGRFVAGLHSRIGEPPGSVAPRLWLGSFHEAHIEARRQLPDLLQLAKDDPRGTYGPAVLGDGRVLMATGNGAVMLSPDGKPLRDYAFGSARGWSRLTLALDQRRFHVGNFVEGRLETRDVETGALLHELDIQRRYCLSGVVAVPTPSDAARARSLAPSACAGGPPRHSSR